MSVVLVTRHDYNVVRKTVRHLKAQTVRRQLEIVIVAPSAETLGLDLTELGDFLRFRVTEVGAIRSTGEAIAAGVRQASAAVVAYAEEHSYPDPGWAEALIAAHRHPWAGVGAMIANANPGSSVSWASLLIDFGPWMEPATAGPTSALPWHHTSYKRALLMEYGPVLPAMLEAEGVLHRDLLARGFRLYFEPAARVHHLNISLLRSYLRGEFYGGRLFAAARARYGRWSLLRRLVYIAGAPLIPLVRLGRVWRDVRRSRRRGVLLPGTVPGLILGLGASGLGELAGYVCGAGNAAERRCTFELDRLRHVAAQDR